MPIEFETKKIHMETLGEYLAEVRQEANLTLEEAAQKSGVYEKFIHYIETGKFHRLPPDVYVLGFLKKLAEVYAISPDPLIDQYKKERGIVEHISRESATPVKSLKSWMQKITITPKLLTITSSVVVGVFAFFYIVVQVFAINRTPALTIIEPKVDSVIKGTSINVSGKTEPGITVSLNGQNIFVNNEGMFQATIGVAPGQKELKIEAQNKFGKINSQIVALRIEDDTHVAGAETIVPSELQLKLVFTKRTTISIIKDNEQLQDEEMPEGSEKKIVAKDKISITTSDAGNTRAILNGKDMGLLGPIGKKITIPWTKEAMELLQLEPAPTPISVPSVIPTPSENPVPKPTTKPSPKPTKTPTPTQAAIPSPTPVPTSAPSATPTPPVEPRLAPPI